MAKRKKKSVTESTKVSEQKYEIVIPISHTKNGIYTIIEKGVIVTENQYPWIFSQTRLKECYKPV